MNIVFDEGLQLEEPFRKALVPLLPAGNSPLKLHSSTSRTDGTPRPEHGFVFLTHLPVDVLKYHAEFFERHKDAPQWFFVLLSRSDHGLMELKNAARKYDLKNCTLYHAGDADAFAAAVQQIAAAGRITKGKAVFLSKHRRAWVSDLAELLFAGNAERYEIMDPVNRSDTDAEFLLLCGEKLRDFRGMALEENREPLFLFRLRESLQHYIQSDCLIEELASVYRMTPERVRGRLFFVDGESERWLSRSRRTAGAEAVSDGIILWDRFGLPLSRSEYTEPRIEASARTIREDMDALRAVLRIPRKEKEDGK